MYVLYVCSQTFTKCHTILHARSRISTPIQLTENTLSLRAFQISSEVPLTQTLVSPRESDDTEERDCWTSRKPLSLTENCLAKNDFTCIGYMKHAHMYIVK